MHLMHDVVVDDLLPSGPGREVAIAGLVVDRLGCAADCILHDLRLAEAADQISRYTELNVIKLQEKFVRPCLINVRTIWC